MEESAEQFSELTSEETFVVVFPLWNSKVLLILAISITLKTLRELSVSVMCMRFGVDSQREVFMEHTILLFDVVETKKETAL